MAVDYIDVNGRRFFPEEFENGGFRVAMFELFNEVMLAFGNQGEVPQAVFDARDDAQYAEAQAKQALDGAVQTIDDARQIVSDAAQVVGDVQGYANAASTASTQAATARDLTLGYRNNSQASAAASLLAQQRAELARDSAVAAKLYNTVAEALAASSPAVAVNAIFAVAGTGAVAIQFYRRTSETAAALVASMSSDEAVALVRDKQNRQAVTYATLSLGLAAVQVGEEFLVKGAGAASEERYKKTDLNTAQLLASNAATAAVSDLQKMIRPSVADMYERGIDEEGAIYREMSSTHMRDTVHEVRKTPGRMGLGDDEGGRFIWADSGGNFGFGPLHMRVSGKPGIRIVAEDGGILHDFSQHSESTEPEGAYSVLESGVFVGSKLLVGMAGEAFSLHLPSILADRSKAHTVVATLASAASAASFSATETLLVDTQSLGPQANLSLRPVNALTPVKGCAINVITAPKSPSAPAVNVLLITDSIGNRQGAQLLKQYLSEWGYASNFIGTMRGSGSATVPNDITGPPGECREGWETGDFTYTITEASQPIAPGGEAEYLSLIKLQQRDRNPFIRVATGADAPEIVRNGYVLDFAFYQSRFSLATPDVVIYALGTNDVRNRDAGSIYDIVKSNDQLLLSRLRAAWPNVRILRTMPGTGMTTARESLWSSKYVPIFRAINAAKNALSDSKLHVIPTWAMSNHDAGYSVSYTSVDAETGVGNVVVTDGIHPSGSGRAELYRAIAPYVAAAAVGLI